MLQIENLLIFETIMVKELLYEICIGLSHWFFKSLKSLEIEKWKLQQFYNFQKNEFYQNLDGIAWKIGLSCPIEVLNIVGWIYIFMAHRAFKFCSNVFLQSLKASENLVLISQTTLEKPRILHFDISILPLVSKNSNSFLLTKVWSY